MKAKIRIESITSTLVSALILLNMSLAGCSNEDDLTSSEELQIFQRESASKGSYPIVGTSQTRCWDGTGNIITPVLGEAFFGQGVQFTHTTPVYTKSSDGLTVKDEVTGLTWQKSHDTGIYY